jgi:hypothetical protein
MGLFDGLFDAPEPNQGVFNQMNDIGEKALKFGKKNQGRAIDTITSNYNRGQDTLGDAVGLWDPVIGQRDQATEMYMNSLGLNGQEGYDAALGAYQQGPGFQFALDQANQNVLRNNAAMGGVASGNTAMALSDRAQQLQNLEFGNWQDRLHGLDNMSAYANKATALTNLGGMHAREGDAKAGVYTNMAPVVMGQFNNNASMLGQQESMRLAAEQQQNNMYASLLGAGLGAVGSFFGA